MTQEVSLRTTSQISKIQVFYLVLRIMGTLIWVLNLSTNIAYITYMKFSDELIFTAYQVFLILRPSLIGALSVFYVMEKLIMSPRKTN